MNPLKYLRFFVLLTLVLKATMQNLVTQASWRREFFSCSPYVTFRAVSIKRTFYLIDLLEYRTLRTSSVVQGQCAGRPKPSDFQGEKILSAPSFGGEVKPSFPCRRFAACKRSLNLRGSRNLGKITTGNLSRPHFHLSLLGSLASLRTEAPGG